MENGDKQEILSAISAIAQKLDEQGRKLDEHSEDIATLSGAISGLAEHMDSELTKVRREMATKDFVERQILASEDRVLAEVQKVATNQETLVDILERKSVITSDEADLVTN